MQRIVAARRQQVQKVKDSERGASSKPPGNSQRVTAPEPLDAEHTRTGARLGAHRGVRTTGRAATVARCKCNGGAFCGNLAATAGARSALAAMVAARLQPRRDCFCGRTPPAASVLAASHSRCAPNCVTCALVCSRQRRRLKERKARGGTTPGARPWLTGCGAVTWPANARHQG